MTNFKMLLAEMEVKETHKMEVDETQMLLIVLKPEYSIKDYLRKYKEHKFVDMYVTSTNFKDDYIQRNKLVDIKNIEVIAFSLPENSIMIKYHNYEYVDVATVRKEKIKNILND